MGADGLQRLPINEPRGVKHLSLNLRIFSQLRGLSDSSAAVTVEIFYIHNFYNRLRLSTWMKTFSLSQLEQQ